MQAGNQNIFAENRKARFDYEIFETYEAGIVLTGDEVKSIRAGSISLKGSYILINSGHPIAVDIHISPYRERDRQVKITSPKRERALLMKKKEIIRLSQKVKETGSTLVPLEVYAKGNLVKVRIALVKGKKTWQKKETLKARDLERETRIKFKL